MKLLYRILISLGLVSLASGPAAAEVCAGSETTLCLQDGRFSVEIEWTDFEGESGVGHVVPGGSDDSGLFWFFSVANWEILVKVLDACDVNDRFWVFAAASTNVEYTLRVTDEEADQVQEYFNPLGKKAPALTDTEAFATCAARASRAPRDEAPPFLDGAR